MVLLWCWEKGCRRPPASDKFFISEKVSLMLFIDESTPRAHTTWIDHQKLPLILRRSIERNAENSKTQNRCCWVQARQNAPRKRQEILALDHHYLQVTLLSSRIGHSEHQHGSNPLPSTRLQSSKNKKVRPLPFEQ